MTQEPSKEAIEAALLARSDAGCIDPDCLGCIKDMLTDAYAIDFAAHQQAIEALAAALWGMIDEVALCRYAKKCEPLMAAIVDAETALAAARKAGTVQIGRGERITWHKTWRRKVDPLQADHDKLQEVYLDRGGDLDIEAEQNRLLRDDVARLQTEVERLKGLLNQVTDRFIENQELKQHATTQRTTIEALAAALKNTGIYLENEHRYCWCGGGNSGGIPIPHQDYCQQANAALDALKPSTEGEGA